MIQDLSRLLRPRSIAVLGGGWAANVVEQCLKAGFDGDLWPIHPTKAAIHGVPAFRSLAELPVAPDAAWIGVNRDTTIEIVRDLAAMGAGGAVCFASGFRETADGAERNAALLAAAGEMPIIGPNCYGLLNYLDGATLWPDQHGGAVGGQNNGVAIITQSSNIAINLTMQKRGLPLAYVMTAGNQAQLGLAEMAMGLLDDPRVTAIGLHIEGIGDLAAFEVMAAKARARQVPIIALTVGRSVQAQAATISHTASLAGGEAGARAFFRRLGIPRVASIPAFVETLKLLHLHGPLPGRDILSVSCSGGEASLMADSVLGRDLHYRPYTEAERGAVSETLNSFVKVANPLDYHTFIWGNQAELTRTFTAAMAPGFDLSFFVIDFPREDRCSTETWEPAVQAIAAAARVTGGRAAAVALLAENIDEARCEELMALGVLPLGGVDEALAAAEAAAEIGEAWARGISAPVLPPIGPAGEVRLLDEAEAKVALAASGLVVPLGRVVTTAEEAVDAAEELGFPVVLKALGIAHKTDAGAVRLNLRSKEEVREAAAALLALKEPQRLLMERMVAGGVAELIVGISRDPVYGLMLTIGAGGILTELLEDSATLLLPVGEAEIRAALESLRIHRVLRGYRGKPVADIASAVGAITSIACFAEANADMIEELDINPLIVSVDGAFAVDALIRGRGENTISA